MLPLVRSSAAFIRVASCAGDIVRFWVFFIWSGGCSLDYPYKIHRYYIKVKRFRIKVSYIKDRQTEQVHKAVL